MYAAYSPVRTEGGGTVGTGWLPPRPDLRDFTASTKEVAEVAGRLGSPKRTKAGNLSLPARVDLRQWCSPVENQGAIGSCTAHAAVGVVEYFERRAHQRHVDGSRLFVYKTTRNLMGVQGDTGAWLRNAMSALVLCGVPPERHHPYTDATPAFDAEPASFVYSVADNFEALQYFSHDPAGTAPPAVVASVKSHLGAGVPSMLGFWGFPSFDRGQEPGDIPVPCPRERAEWGHAIVAVGYDDAKVVTNTVCNVRTTGAFLIRNSWGSGWGRGGYGWLPYEYVLRGHALDFWSLLRMEWVDTAQFGYGQN